jgi:hypothetical protein
MREILVLGFLVLIGSLHSLTAQDWSAYKEVSLAHAWAQAMIAPKGALKKGSGPAQSFEGSPQDHKFLVTAVYTGKFRKMAPNRLEFVAAWGKSMGAQDFTQHFVDEIEVRAEGMTAWLSLQDVLVDYFRGEVKPGASLQFWMMYLGAIQQDRVFVVNEFQLVK